jgi:hypothetical protein
VERDFVLLLSVVPIFILWTIMVVLMSYDDDDNNNNNNNESN